MGNANTGLLQAQQATAIGLASWTSPMVAADEKRAVLRTDWFLDCAHNELSLPYAAEWFPTTVTENQSDRTCPTRILIFSHFTERDGAALPKSVAKVLNSHQTQIQYLILTTDDIRRDGQAAIDRNNRNRYAAETHDRYAETWGEVVVNVGQDRVNTGLLSINTWETRFAQQPNRQNVTIQPPHISRQLFGKAIIRQEIMSTIPSPPDARHLIEVKATQGKGLAIFAKEKIPRGTRLVAESPLLKAPINHTTGGADVMRAFNNLSASSQQAYLELHGYASEDTKKRHNWNMLGDLDRQVLAIYVANCWGRDVFRLASRFNHSCIPNIHNAYNSTIQKETFHNIRDIEIGEELTISYVLGICSRSERQVRLSKWGFECTCSVLAALFQEAESISPVLLASEKTIKRFRETAALMRSLGLVGKALNNCYRDAAFCSAFSGNVQMASLWAEKEVEVDYYCLGKDHPDYPKEVRVLEQLRAAAKSKKPFHYMQIRWVLGGTKDLNRI
ncbi:hypothetical protein V496_01445 [Pseudogymnoascus sp. VKM F-4515 (FW-2607)]|nr:hypothetical protein V496_01445 [Pseudogymnoascus sp. VKM F-4515 (FW-2607)]